MCNGAGQGEDDAVFESEAELLDRVVGSLKATFPRVPEGEIRDCVAGIYERFDDATVRAYIPVLVDRQARVTLMRASAGRRAEDHLVGA